LRKQREEGKKKKGKTERKERELQKIREEVCRTTRAIYIEPLASRPPFAFQESSESCEEERNIERKILEAYNMQPLWEKNLKKHYKAFDDIFAPCTYNVIINDFEEEKQVSKEL
jgi:hypothetical protein